MNTGKDSPQQMSLGLSAEIAVKTTPIQSEPTKTGLNIFSSNRVESLLEAMGHHLNENPLDTVFAAEEIVVSSRAMGRWVNLELAKQNGIAANINHTLPASWIWSLVSGLVKDAPEQDPLGRASSTWKIYGLLPEMKQRSEFRQLKHYLENDDNGLKRWQLSSRIADTLDRYQLYRPELIRAWSHTGSIKPKDEHLLWQSILWKALIKNIEVPHRVEVIDRLLEKLNSSTVIQSLPQRFNLFVLSSLPPLFVDILHALSKHCQINMFHHSPTDQYWAKLENKTEVARKRLRNPDEIDYYETGNELLASWGRQGQAFQDLLLDNNDSLEAEVEYFPDNDSDMLLHQIQSSILNIDEDDGIMSDQDDSLQIHICHSAFRECQVLHDQLLHAMQADPQLKPEDILVMVPEISAYAPYIDAIFRKDASGNKDFINWNLSDTTVADEHPLIGSFFSLLNLPNCRLTTSEVLSYLDIPECQKRFDLTVETVENIVHMVKASNVRWGVDGEHKKELGLPEMVENTWKQAEQRLFSGYAMGDVEYWKRDNKPTIAPIDLTSTDKATSLGKFWAILEQLTQWRKQLSEERTAVAWQKSLNTLLDQFFTNLSDLDHFGSAEYRRESDGKIQQIRDVLDELMKNAGDVIISPDLLQQWLKDSLGDKRINGRYFSGGVTFCGMRPMRSLPFKVICLLGMNNAPFPRLDHAVEFDAMKNSWRQGDPVKGDEDRYLLLETLLCARDKLIITYSGRDLKDNSERQPSVLVQELVDYVDEHFSLNTGELDTGQQSVKDSITTLHPLQPFSVDNYNSINPHSHDKYWYEVCRASIEEKSQLDASSWPASTISLQDDREGDSHIKLDRLKKFFKHPVKFFFNEQLKIYLSEQISSEDEEPFNLNSLEKWQVKQDMLDACISGKKVKQDELSAKGMLPHGAISQLEYNATENEIAATEVFLREFEGSEPESRRINITVDGTNITGQVGDCIKKKGLLCKTASKLQGKYLLPAFLDHLVLCADGQLEETEKSVLVTRENQIIFQHCSEQEAKDLLMTYIALYKDGQTRPLPVFPNASWAWAEKKGNEKAKRTAAFGKWKSQWSPHYDDWKDEYIKLALRGFDSKNPFSTEEFQSLTDTIYDTALAHCKNTIIEENKPKENRQ